MALAIRSSSSAISNSGSTATTMSVTKPAGTAAGDILLAIVANDPAMPTAQTGWTLAGRGTTNAALNVYWKLAGASESASYSFTIAGNSSTIVDLLALSGADTATPVAAITFGGSATDATPLVAPSVTPTRANSLLFAAYATRGGVQSFTPPTGMSEQYDNNDTWAALSVNTLALTTTSATGTKSATPATADSYSSVSIVANPAAAGGDVTAPTVPGSFTATASGQNAVNLAWTASTDAVGVTGYTITRNGTTITTTATGTSYADTGLTPGTLYTYTISAHDAAGNASATATASATTASSLPAMPNQVSGVQLRTTTAGTVIYKYEVQTSTDGALTAGQRQAFVYVPAGRVGQATAKMVFAGHGSGDTVSTFMEQGAATLPLLDLLADAGYVVIVPNYEQTYGNTDGQARLARSHTYLTGVWASAGTVMFGFSMGAAIAAVAAHKDTIPAIRALQLVAAPLKWSTFAPESSGIIYTAYGVAVGDNAAFATATAAWDPFRQPVAEYAGQRWRVNTSSDDGYATLRPSAVEFLGNISGVAAQALDVQVTGAHGAPGQFANPAAMVSFYEAAIAAPTTLGKLRLGTGTVGLRVGVNAVSKAYIGSTQVWP